MTKLPKVGLLIESSRAAGRAVLKGVADYAHHHGRWSFYWEPGGLEKAWPKLRSLNLQGIILRDVSKLEEVLRFGIPTVVLGHSRSEVPGVVNVVTDSAAIGRMGAEHLLGCGFKRFAYCGMTVAPGELASWSRLREDSFRQPLEEAGLPCCTYSTAPAGRRSWNQERRAMIRWLRALPRPCGLMACNDDLGKEVIEACKLAGLAVPDDIAVVGVDNDELVCGFSDPPMSSVAVNFEHAGYEAASVLDRLMQGIKRVPFRIVVRASRVVPRRSTDIVAVEDAPLAKALRFVRDRAQTSVSVNAVAQAAGLSRRALEKRFRRFLKHSVLNEIRRVRTDQIARLLAETELPVVQIALDLGFDDVQHVSRYFRAVRGLTPLAYRKAHGRRYAGAGEA
jgi:LacI family transcriptional regulator